MEEKDKGGKGKGQEDNARIASELLSNSVPRTGGFCFGFPAADRRDGQGKEKGKAGGGPINPYDEGVDRDVHMDGPPMPQFIRGRPPASQPPSQPLEKAKGVVKGVCLTTVGH